MIRRAFFFFLLVVAVIVVGREAVLVETEGVGALTAEWIFLVPHEQRLLYEREKNK